MTSYVITAVYTMQVLADQWEERMLFLMEVSTMTVTEPYRLGTWKVWLQCRKEFVYVGKQGPRFVIHKCVPNLKERSSLKVDSFTGHGLHSCGLCSFVVDSN